MELLLNLIWLAVGLLMTAAVCRRVCTGLSARECLQLGVAVLCLWVVLFPAISMTDDLQQVPFASETRTFQLSGTHGHQYLNLLFVSLLLLLSLQASFAISYFARRVMVGPASLHEGFLRRVVSRPPPVLAR